MDLSAFVATAREWVLRTGPSVILVVVLTLVALKLAGVLSRRVFTAIAARAKDAEAQKRADTLGSVVKYILGVVITAVAFMMLLKELGIDIAPILAAAGIVGLAVGFGAQHLVQDVISGFFILLEDQIRVGDVVVLGDKGGIVEKVNLRMTILRDLAGNVHFIRNGQIGVVTNMTKEFSRYVFEVGVAYREDVDEVIGVIKEVDEGMRGDPEYSGVILEPIEILGLDKFADSAVVIKARTKTKPMEQWRVGREFNRRLKKAFDERNIEIPFPHHTVYMGQDKAGSSPPLNVRMKGGES
ncbi:MAG: mechanosensitive ion channel family protein [Nitrospirota bacterium]|jgi:small-conductance mechanosensitive channel